MRIHNANARLLNDNTQAWNARWKLLETAQEEINAQYYTWDHDVFGKAMLGHVFYKAQQGVKTRVMIDAVGDTLGTRGFKSHLGGKDYLQELVALPNAEAKVYHPHSKKVLSLLRHPLGTQGIAANHDKILEVDGEAAITGGRNTGHHYFIHPDDDPHAWRDHDILLEGEEAAKQLRDAVDEEYHAGWINSEVKPDLFNFKKRDKELLGAYHMMDAWLKGAATNQDELLEHALSQLEEGPNRRERKALKKLAQELVQYRQLQNTYHDPEPKATPVKVQIVDRTSSAGSGLDDMNQTLLDLVKNARKSILIQSPYYVLTEPIIEALKEAGERGVEIRIATNSPSSTDSYFTQAFFLNDWRRSLETIPNLHLFAATGERKHHGKLAVIDGEISVVGTYNLDLVSSEVNGEVGAVVYSKEFADETLKAVEQDFADPTVGYQEYLLNGFGPEDHVEPEVLQGYDKRIKRWNWARRHLPQLESVRRWARPGPGELVSHRGHGSQPENTMAALQAGVESGAHRIELDVQSNADGEFVVLHDPTVDRTTTGQGKVKDLTSDELKALGVPFFQDVVNWAVANDVALDVDVKHPHEGEEKKLAPLLKGLKDPWVTSYDADFMERLEAHAPELTTGILVHERPLATRAAWGAALGLAAGAATLNPVGALAGLVLGAAAGFGVARAQLRRKDLDRQVDMHIPGRRTVNKKLVQEAKERGKQVAVYTVNDPKKADKLWGWGVDALITDHPEGL